MQTKYQSLIESLTNILIGYLTALLSQVIIYPLMNIEVTFSENLLLGLFFTVVSIARGYYARRLFNWIGNKSKKGGLVVEFETYKTITKSKREFINKE